MQQVSKVGIDLFFCFIVGFLIIQASSSARQNEELTNSLSVESTRISVENFE